MDNLLDLINMARSILDAGFDVDTFLTWRDLAFLCLLGLLGPLNYYTKNFCAFTRDTAPRSLLAGEGILEAARQEIVEPPDLKGSVAKLQLCGKGSRFVPWLLRKKKWCPLDSLKPDQQQ
jgi:hypothetical protein